MEKLQLQKRWPHTPGYEIRENAPLSSRISVHVLPEGAPRPTYDLEELYLFDWLQSNQTPNTCVVIPKSDVSVDITFTRMAEIYGITSWCKFIRESTSKRNTTTANVFVLFRAPPEMLDGDLFNLAIIPVFLVSPQVRLVFMVKPRDREDVLLAIDHVLFATRIEVHAMPKPRDHSRYLEEEEAYLLEYLYDDPDAPALVVLPHHQHPHSITKLTEMARRENITWCRFIKDDNQHYAREDEWKKYVFFVASMRTVDGCIFRDVTTRQMVSRRDVTAVLMCRECVEGEVKSELHRFIHLSKKGGDDGTGQIA